MAVALGAGAGARAAATATLARVRAVAAAVAAATAKLLHSVAGKPVRVIDGYGVPIYHYCVNA
jgi:hypothetical protein